MQTIKKCERKTSQFIHKLSVINLRTWHASKPSNCQRTHLCSKRALQIFRKHCSWSLFRHKAFLSHFATAVIKNYLRVNVFSGIYQWVINLNNINISIVSKIKKAHYSKMSTLYVEILECWWITSSAQIQTSIKVQPSVWWEIEDELIVVWNIMLKR